MVSSTGSGRFWGAIAAFLALYLVDGINAFLPQQDFSPMLSSLKKASERIPHNNCPRTVCAARIGGGDQKTLDFLLDQQTRFALVKAQLSLKGGDSSLQEVFVVGQARLPISSQSNIRSDRYRNCVVLSQQDTKNEKRDTSIPGMLVPLTSPAQLKLLSFAKASRPLSKSVLLGLNALLVNRDGALFDNLPWSQWSVDPQKRNYDAANNPINARFHLGKRDAYNRLMGKDWQGRSVSVGNMALRLKYMLDGDDDQEESTNNIDADTSKVSLAQRILELQIRELEMDLAEWDYQLAIAKTNEPDQVEKLQEGRETCKMHLVESRQKSQALLEQEAGPPGNDPFSIVTSILNDVADWTTDYGNNKAPYRGAMGYAPLLDTKADIAGSTLPYTSPYDVLREILDDQLNCEVIGVVLENTSLLAQTLALGGAVVLRRKTAKKTISLDGEELTIKDEDEDFGNLGAKGGETMLVECDADEALAMGLTCNVPIHLEPGVWDRASITVSRVAPSDSREEPALSVSNALLLWEPRDPELTLLEEGQNRTERKASPLRIPRTTTSLFDNMFESAPDDAPAALFPTDNPIQSLQQYDELNDEGKARTLMSISNFNGKLPRPRVLRKDAKSRKGTNALDDLLVPLVDESVRRQYLMRDAEVRGDTETLERLRKEKTKRQVAKEKAEEARALGDELAAQLWEEEAGLFGDLRADITQDEGAYSRFLDRDEWYERSRRAQAKKLDKKKFGTLLDGIE